jgi:hypothetical protein
MRFRITIRNDEPRLELRGYADLEPLALQHFAATLKPYGLVIASPADDDYDPFDDAP